MAELTSARWTRYGKDRLYVSAADGTRVGWLDLLTGEQHLEVPALNREFAEALEPHLPRPTAGSPPAVVPDPPAATGTSVREWQDLALHRPGQLVRTEAEQQLAQMKERSRVGAFLARALDLKTDERAYRVGAGGEETVGTRLEKLTKHGWHVLHSIEVGKGDSDIDHLLIGPGGCFTINTKNHPNKQVWVGEHVIKVNGHSTRYLPIARYEAERARRLLSQAAGWEVPVRAALVILTGTVIPQVTIKKMPADVVVLDRMDVPRVFKRAKARMSATQVHQLHDLARRSTLWTE